MPQEDVVPLEEVYFICIYLAIGLNLSQTTFTNEIFLIHCIIYQKIKYTFENVSSPLNTIFVTKYMVDQNMQTIRNPVTSPL